MGSRTQRSSSQKIPVAEIELTKDALQRELTGGKLFRQEVPLKDGGPYLK